MILSFLDCAELPDHVATDCNDYKQGGAPSVAILNLDHTITDFSNDAQWAANIAAGKVKIINRVKASIPENAEVTSENPVACGAQTILDGWDWTMEILDGNRNAFNDSFYENLNLKSAAVVLWMKDEGEVTVVNRACTFKAKPIFPGSNRERQQYKIIGEWSTKPNEFPQTFVAPTAVFDY
jgi:hypothetical protein